MKKFIISAITLAILCMVFACAEPSSSNDSSTKTATNKGLPMSLVGTWKVVKYTYIDIEQVYNEETYEWEDVENTKEEIVGADEEYKIIIKEDDTISYSMDGKSKDGSTSTSKGPFGSILLYDAIDETINITTTQGSTITWTYKLSGNTLKINGDFFWWSTMTLTK